VVAEVKVTGELTMGLAETVKLVVKGCMLSTVRVLELLAVFAGDDESVTVCVTM